MTIRSPITVLAWMAVLAACRDGAEPTATRRVPIAANAVPAAGTERQITNSGTAFQPAISGDRIVWADLFSDIYMLELSTGQITGVAQASSHPLWGWPAISGDRIAWSSSEVDVGSFGQHLDVEPGAIYAFDLASVTTRLISSNGSWFKRPVAISGDRVVWADFGQDYSSFGIVNWDIYVLDLTGGAQRITSNSARQSGPAISGSRIVWQDERNNGTSDIYMLDLAGGGEQRITNSGHAFWPAISGDRIVWQDDRNGGDWDIYMLDLAGGGEQLISTGPQSSFAPAISGDRIVWQDGRNGNWDIYMFDLATGTEWQITTDPSDQENPAISGDRIVWEDKRNGNSDIYMFELSPPPLAITPPGPLTVPADPGRCDAQVSLGTPTTTGGTPPIATAASPAPPYPVGGTAAGTLPTLVTWTATDASGNTASATQVVIVQDQERPLIGAAPAVVITTDPGQPTASVTLREPISSDNCPGWTIAGVRSDGLPLGAPYPVGQTQVTWTATDASGNKSAAVTGTVTVVDKEPPAITVPADFSVNATNPSGAVVSYVASAKDNVAGTVPVSCSPTSGSSLAIGTTSVTCVATDPSGNQASATFRVTVLSAQAQLGNLGSTLASLGLPSGTVTSLRAKLDAALAAANAGDRVTACTNLQDFINETQAQAGKKKISAADAQTLIAEAQRIRAVLGC